MINQHIQAAIAELQEFIDDRPDAREVRKALAVKLVYQDYNSLIGALNLEGLVAAMTVPGSTNTEVFLTYVTQVLAPQLWKGAIVVMDNPKVHHAERVKIAIESVGALVKFLPPYSPDLSPIELCWSKLKQFLRSREARTLELLDQAMAEAVNYITEDDAFGWFNHCGLFT